MRDLVSSETNARSGASTTGPALQLPITPQSLRWDRYNSNELFLSKRMTSSVAKVSFRDFQSSEVCETDDGSLEKKKESISANCQTQETDRAGEGKGVGKQQPGGLPGCFVDSGWHGKRSWRFGHVPERALSGIPGLPTGTRPETQA